MTLDNPRQDPTSVSLDVSHRAQTSPATLDVSHRVQTSSAALDVSHQANITYADEDDWERPTLGNEPYAPLYPPKTTEEYEMRKIHYPYPVEKAGEIKARRSRWMD
jgi:hypothetical protein